MYINPAIIEIRNKSSVSNPRSSERRDGAFKLRNKRKIELIIQTAKMFL